MAAGKRLRRRSAGAPRHRRTGGRLDGHCSGCAAPYLNSGGAPRSSKTGWPSKGCGDTATPVRGSCERSWGRVARRRGRRGRWGWGHRVAVPDQAPPAASLSGTGTATRPAAPGPAGDGSGLRADPCRCRGGQEACRRLTGRGCWRSRLIGVVVRRVASSGGAGSSLSL